MIDGKKQTRKRPIPALMIAALVLAGMLLLANLPAIPAWLHTYASSLPLSVAGIGYAILQFRVRPPRAVLLKRLFLAATFVTWAVDQLLNPGKLAIFVGDIVIGAYVLDLYWASQEQISTVRVPSVSNPDRGA